MSLVPFLYAFVSLLGSKSDFSYSSEEYKLVNKDLIVGKAGLHNQQHRNPDVE